MMKALVIGLTASLAWTVQPALTYAHARPATQNVANPELTPGTEHVHHFEIRSSVQVPREALKEAYDASREAYTHKLEKFAKCTPADAHKAVSAAHPGMKIETVQLRNIRTSLVYVAVAEDEEDRYLVIVDAGNCRILLDRPIPTHHERVFAD